MRKALALALTIMVLLTFVVSPVAAGMFDRKATWEKYKYRCGDGNMGWLRTPDFKNGGFDTGDTSDWYVASDLGPSRVSWGVDTENNNKYFKSNVSHDSIIVEGTVHLGQTIQLSSATGMSFQHRCTEYTAVAGSADDVEIRIFVDGVEVYSYVVSGTYTWEQAYVDLSGYQGIHNVYIEFYSLTQSAEVGIDNVHLVGPGFS